MSTENTQAAADARELADIAVKLATLGTNKGLSGAPLGAFVGVALRLIADRRQLLATVAQDVKDITP